MIVKYVKERGYKGQDPNFTLGKEYIVLGVRGGPSNNPLEIGVQRESDNYPVVLELSCFEVIDNRIPEGWIFYNREDNYFELQPCEFDGDFWELFHDGDPEAKTVFKKVVEKVRHFHGL